MSGHSLKSRETFMGPTCHSQPSPLPQAQGIPSSHRVTSLRSPSPAHSFPLSGKFFPLFSATPHLTLKAQWSHLLGQPLQTILCVLLARPYCWPWSTATFIVHLPVSPVACKPLEQRQILSTCLSWQLIYAWQGKALNKCPSE